MKIWIICTGEPVPFLPSEAGDRFLRAGKIAEYLTLQGHDVTWWTARFNHYDKSFRDVEANTPVQLLETAPRMIFLDSCGYRRHIGVRRFVDHWQVGRAFRKICREQPEPDLILASFPLVELCHEAVRFGQEKHLPVAVDIRDLWPDVITERLSKRIGYLSKILCLPYEMLCRHVFRKADRVIGITDGMQSWCYNRFGRERSKKDLDEVFRQFKKRPEKSNWNDTEMLSFWSERGVDLSRDVTRLVWTGSIIRETDGATLLHAISKLPKGIEESLEIVVAGKGSLVPKVEALSDQHACLKYVGWVGDSEMNYLLERSHIGLLCYLDRFDFQISTPNKIIDYCAAGMRILTNLTGEVKALAENDDFIINYPTGDVQRLADLLLEISENPNGFRVKYDPARRVFDDQFDADCVLPNIEAYLARVVESASP